MNKIKGKNLKITTDILVEKLTTLKNDTFSINGRYVRSGGLHKTMVLIEQHYCLEC